MNEFLQQFVIESREIAAAASEGLLVLEHTPRDAAHLDAVFRAFHTLKGGAGIVEFAAMERAVHAAEDILSEARSDEHPLTIARVGQCLACLDQVLQWLDAIEQTDGLPEAAAGQADRLISQMERSSDSEPTRSAIPSKDSPVAVWLEDSLQKHARARAQARTAVRFVPAADSFYQGEDPLELMTLLPGLLALDCSPVEDWGPLDTLDLFACNLSLTALSAASLSDVTAHFQGRSGKCDIVAVASAVSVQSEITTREPALSIRVIDVISAQAELLSETKPEDFVGRVTAAGQTATNALRFCGRSRDAERVIQGMRKSLQERTVQPLQQALVEALTIAIPEAAAPSKPSPASDIVARTFRVESERVDALVRLAGELTVVNNAIGHVVKLAQAGDPSVADLLKDRHSTLQHLVNELQRSVLGIRVQPLRVVFQRFPRLVREMSTSQGKSVKLVIEGENTEADKAVVEMLFEPLLHMVRNAIDHGVESPSGRASSGKPPVATLLTKAMRQSDQVLIQINDDGAGIDIARVREVAKTRGVATEEQLNAMSEADVLDLIFAPGFSTATAVTQASGRGVGMDAARRTVERAGGRVSIATRAGAGTSVGITVPFSVMMTHVMTVEAGGQMFGLPLEAIIETVRVPRAAIVKVGAAHAVVLRERTIPVIDLATLLGVEQTRRDTTEVTLVVAAAGGEWGGFRVDRLGERLDLILKPLEGLLTETPGILGTTLLGDGRVLLVLDIGEMLQ